MRGRVSSVIRSEGNGAGAVRLTPGDDKVEQPLSRGSNSNVQRPEAGGRDFRNVYPAAWPPAELEEAVVSWLAERAIGESR